MTCSAIYLRVPGEPRGQARARHSRWGTHKAEGQADYEDTIKTVWIQAGRPQLPSGPYRVEVRAYMARPQGHYRKDGSLSTAALRSPHPTKRPDADNFLKQVDALVAVGALPDDAAMVEAVVRKVWATTPHGPCLEVLAVSLDGAA